MAWSPWIELALPEPDPSEPQPFDLPAPKGPRYPYGMRLQFDNHVLDAAHLDVGEVKEGQEFDMRGFGKVVGFRNEDGQRCVTIQLTRIKVENEDAETEGPGEGEEKD